MTPLPHAAAEPLHILPPWLVAVVLSAIPLLIFALLMLLFWWLWRRVRSRLKEERKNAPRGTKRGSRKGLSKRIEAIRRRYVELSQYREGCHALSGLIKAHLEKRTGVEVEEMTVAEVGPRLADKRHGEYLLSLRDCQYQRRPPSKRDFESLCDRARAVFAKKSRKGSGHGS